MQNSDIEGSKVFGQNIFVCIEINSFSGQKHEFSAAIHLWKFENTYEIADFLHIFHWKNCFSASRIPD